MEGLDSLVLEPVFSTRNRCVIGARVDTHGDDAAAVNAALRLVQVFISQRGFERLYVCLDRVTTSDLACLRPILQLLQEVPEARTRLCLVYQPEATQGVGQLPVALSLLSALDVELCMALAEITPEFLLRLKELPMQAVQLDAGILHHYAVISPGCVEELLIIAKSRGLNLLAWNVRDQIQLSRMLALGCQCLHGGLIGPPMTISGLFRNGMGSPERGSNYG